MVGLRVDKLVKRFPVMGAKSASQLVLNEVEFSVREGSFTTVVGPSGCGKSTLLNIIAGIERASSGTAEVLESESGAARVGYVFQTPRLLPWLSVLKNVTLAQRSQEGRPIAVKGSEYLEMVGLRAADYAKFPLQLSGGMQQRAGIARALGIEPDVLLMDEPFSHLDAITASHLRNIVIELWERTSKTILFVTHDLREALELGDRMLILGVGGDLLDDLENPLPRPRDTAGTAFAEVYKGWSERFTELTERRG